MFYFETGTFKHSDSCCFNEYTHVLQQTFFRFILIIHTIPRVYIAYGVALDARCLTSSGTDNTDNKLGNLELIDVDKILTRHQASIFNCKEIPEV